MNRAQTRWPEVRFTYLARLVTEKALDSDFKVALENVEGGTGEFVETGSLDLQGEGIEFRAGDVLFGKLRPYLTKVWLADRRGAAVGDFHVYRPDGVESEFLKYMLLNPDYIDLVNSSTFGSKMPRASWDSVRNMRHAVPSRPEQRQVAKFLERETGQIDAMIAKQEQLIATLAERRQAVITQAVTRGLDTGVELKVSDHAWLSELPAHWTVQPLRRGLDFVTSGSRGWAEFYVEDGDRFIRIGNLLRGSLELDMTDTQHVRLPKGVEGMRSITREGDLLFSITAYLGSVAVVRREWAGSYVSQHVAIARLDPGKFLPQFVGYFVLSSPGQRQLSEQAYGGTKIQLSLEDIRGLFTTTPPLDEQRAIVAYLEATTHRIDSLSAKAKEMVTILRERRQALISAAVTGKINVRDRT